jgi:formylglycine-generating enzyme required for sulfatase activity
MDTTFIDIVKKLVTEQGKETLLNQSKCKSFLADYAKGDYKKECRLLLQVLESGCQNAIINTPDFESIRPKIIQQLIEDELIAEHAAVEIVDLLALVLREDTIQKNIAEQLKKQNDQLTRENNLFRVTLDNLKIKNTQLKQTLRTKEQECIYLQIENNDYRTKCNQLMSAYKIINEENKINKKKLQEALNKQNKLESIEVIDTSTRDTKAKTIPDGFVKIQGGTFMMGSPVSEVGRGNDEAQHRVTVSGFYMGQFEVTQAEYETIIGSNPSEFKGGSLPVENVSWFDAVFYCNKRSTREGLTPAYTIDGENVTWNRNTNGYRLPTEAEWEYACRAGTTGPFSTGNNITTAQANYNTKGTTDVGSFASNPWGLYDMHGNVWEWCWDWYGAYSMTDQTDPTGAAPESNRVLSGGCWNNTAQNLRSANRYYNSPSYRNYFIGFRLVRP